MNADQNCVHPLPSSDMNLTTILSASLICFFLVTSSTFAQSQTTGRIVGTVRDPNGARIPDAQVIIRNNATAEERETKTDAQGNYTVSLLAPGNYSVRIASPGF